MANTFNLGNGNWAQKTEKLLAYNAENDNYKPLPFDFDRGSTATRVNRDGLIETVATDEPRIDFLNNTKGHLLLEPSRQNKVPYSEDFTQWDLFSSGTGASNPVVTSNNGISPDGSQNADRIQFDAGTSGYSQITDTFTIFGTVETFSIYLKSNDSSEYAIQILQSNSPLNTVTVTSQWQRFSFTATNTSPDKYGLRLDSSSSETADILAWGAQLETGSYATSYIPTSGSAVTRSADVCNNAGNSNVFNDSEGVLYAEIAALANDGTTRRFSISDGSYSNRITLELDETSNTLKAFIVSANTTYYSPSEVLSDITNYNKIAIKYKQNDFSLWVNGFEFDVDNSGNTPINLSQMQFADGNGSDVPFYGKVKDLRVYNTALSDSELQALTQV